jgi:primosomal protein N' (replication factor Y)
MFVEVILPLALPKTFTYAVPPDLQTEVGVGKRVLVQFGKKRIYSGLIHRITTKAPEYPAKWVLDVLDDLPIVTPEQFLFWDWMAAYYMCTLGEVFIAAVPAGFKLESETKVTRGQSEDTPWDTLSDDEFLIMEALETTTTLKMAEVMAILNLKNPAKVLNKLIEKGLVAMEETLKPELQPRTLKSVRLHPNWPAEHLEQAFEQLKRAPKQSSALLALMALTSQQTTWVPYKLLAEKPHVDAAAIKQLMEKGFIEIAERDPFLATSASVVGLKELSSSQKTALTQVRTALEEQGGSLLFGVTGSGKTEVYAHLIQEVLQRGQRVLYLLPEIALTAQLIQRLKSQFGEQVEVYHSRVREKDRLRLWQNLAVDAPQTPQVIVGARSALLLPLTRLGLIIVDEEHESSFKQYEPAPRYHARDAAMWLARKLGAHILLGSATPSLESWYLAQTGKLGLVEMKERFGQASLPRIQIVNIKGGATEVSGSGLFSQVLLERIAENIAEKKRVILFQNRRGFSPHVQCGDCGTVVMCHNCDISLTYHKVKNKLQCHYCGFSVPVQLKCAACGSTHLKMAGYGTERIVEELEIIFPQAKVARMDQDSVRKKNAVEKLLEDFDAGNIDILVGTQMVTKGLDFDKVGLVGIILADALLYYPDFRAYERAYQLMAQVAGRAGRRNAEGEVLIQTYMPEHFTIKLVQANDYEAMAAAQLQDREKFQYPPFYRMIRVTLFHKDRQILLAGATILGDRLRAELKEGVLGPEFPPTERLKGMYVIELHVKLKRLAAVQPIKQRIKQHADYIFLTPPYHAVRVVYDVDPA